ncbi:MAG: hypothetical protein ABIR55_16025, partial [Burkholderiaceae bacterium]
MIVRTRGEEGREVKERGSRSVRRQAADKLCQLAGFGDSNPGWTISLEVGGLFDAKAQNLSRRLRLAYDGALERYDLLL